MPRGTEPTELPQVWEGGGRTSVFRRELDKLLDQHGIRSIGEEKHMAIRKRGREEGTGKREKREKWRKRKREEIEVEAEKEGIEKGDDGKVEARPMWREKNREDCRLGQEEKREEVKGRETLEDTQPPGSNGAYQDQHADPTMGEDQFTQAAIPTAFMLKEESELWAMSFEELYQHAKSKHFGDGRKTGRIRIIQWLCKKEGITPYVAPSIIPPVDTTDKDSTMPVLRPTGAVAHPEAILQTSDPALQLLIDEKEMKYQTWSAANLLTLCMQRSYQLLKDSKGKLPGKSIAAMAKWCASWDVLKSEREKSWWLGDGIELVNRAKAMGYQGPSKKYEVILWLRTTPEEAEVEVARVAEPTPNSNPSKTGAGKTKQVSKRRAKGSTYTNEGWKFS
jgi:hypothetical protein